LCTRCLPACPPHPPPSVAASLAPSCREGTAYSRAPAWRRPSSLARWRCFDKCVCGLGEGGSRVGEQGRAGHHATAVCVLGGWRLMLTSVVSVAPRSLVVAHASHTPPRNPPPPIPRCAPPRVLHARCTPPPPCICRAMQLYPRASPDVIVSALLDLATQGVSCARCGLSCPSRALCLQFLSAVTPWSCIAVLRVCVCARGPHCHRYQQPQPAAPCPRAAARVPCRLRR
jgi:hypothetical protein